MINSVTHMWGDRNLMFPTILAICGGLLSLPMAKVGTIIITPISKLPKQVGGGGKLMLLSGQFGC
jgi:hypothetical protein